MVMRTVKMLGLEVTDATWTVLWDGVTVASGAVVAGSLDVEHNQQVIGTWTFEDNDSAILTEHSMSITVNSGVIKAGTVWFSTDGIHSDDPALGELGISDASDTVGPGYWRPHHSGPFGDGSDTALAERSSILINGAVPDPGPDVVPTGTTENPTWTGWFFEVASGNELTCTGRCPAQWVALV